jgi:hypothetical protein
MTTPDAVPAEDAAEQRLTATGDRAPAPEPAARLEVSEADLAEQAQPVDDEEHAAARELPLEVDPADAAEQAAVVPLDDERDPV